VFLSYICMRFGMRVFVIHLYACLSAFFSYICMRFFFIHLYACLYVFFSYICMRVCMRVFFMHLYACLCACFLHTFVYLYLGRPWLNGECCHPITRGLVIQSPITAPKKDWLADSWRGGSSPPCHS